MGVESNFYLVPGASGIRPAPANVCALIAGLKPPGYLCDPQSSRFALAAHQYAGAANFPETPEGFFWQIGRARHTGRLADLETKLAQHEAADLLLRWRTTDLARSGLNYPLTITPATEGIY